MAGINGFGANYNKGINVGGLNQSGNAKNTQQAKNELTELKLNTNQLDGFVKSNNAEVQEAKKEDDKPKEGGDGAKKGKKSYGDYLNKHLNKFGGGEGLNLQADTEATAAGCVIVAFLDWAVHGFQ